MYLAIKQSKELPYMSIKVNINNNSALTGPSETCNLFKNIKSLRAPTGVAYIGEDFKGIILKT